MADEKPTPEDTNDEPKAMPVDRWVVIFGSILVVAAVCLEIWFSRISPEIVALGVASGAAAILWGLFPSVNAAGGRVGWLRVAGPAAIAIFLYGSMVNGLRSTPQRSLRTLFAANAAAPGSTYFQKLDLGGGRTLRLLDVESLSEGQIVADVEDLSGILQRFNKIHPRHKIDINTEVKNILSRTLLGIGVTGSIHGEAMSLIGEVLERKPKDEDERAQYDSRWSSLIERAADGNCMFRKRVDRFPFAIIWVQSDESSDVTAIIAGDNFVDGHVLRAPVIANPHRRSVYGLAEAIVVELPTADSWVGGLFDWLATIDGAV